MVFGGGCWAKRTGVLYTGRAFDFEAAEMLSEGLRMGWMEELGGGRNKWEDIGV